MADPVTGAVSEAALIQKIMSVLDRIDLKTNELRVSVNSKISWLPVPLQDSVRRGWKSFTGFMSRLWHKLTEIVTNLGSPIRLWDTADAWSAAVGGPVSGQVQAAEAGILTVDDNWDGDAATAYRQMLPLQKTALDKIKSAHTDGIASALSDVAKGIIAFWGSLLAALLALVGSLIGAIASTAVILGMPAAPFIAAGGACTAIGAIFVGGQILKSVASSANTTLQQKLADNSGHYNRHWPPATTA